MTAVLELPDILYFPTKNLVFVYNIYPSLGLGVSSIQESLQLFFKFGVGALIQKDVHFNS